MRKGLILALLSLCLVSCAQGGESSSSQSLSDPYTLPDLEGYTLREARLLVGADILFEEVDVESNKYIEGDILGYTEYEAGDVVEKGTRVKVNVAERLSTSLSVNDGLINYTNQIAMTTGPDSQNSELLLNAGARGTDLGIPFTLPDGRTMLLYGDTFSGDNMSGLWQSNFMAITSDDDLTDGLKFDELVINETNGAVKPFAQGAHQSGSETDKSVEVTKIPTGGISIGEDVYIFYMSIRYWGVAGSWLVNYNQCLKATDDTYTEWEEVSSLRWTEDELYYAGQIYPFKNPNDDYIYFLMIPGGRNDGATMMRVTEEDFETRDEYEYLVAEDTWVKGDSGMSQLNSSPYYVIDPSFSEPSLMYSTYLNKYVACALRGSAICLLTSDSVTGPYESHSVLKSEDFAGLYGGFVYAPFSDCGGQRIYLQLSQWTPIYNTSLVEVVFA